MHNWCKCNKLHLHKRSKSTKKGGVNKRLREAGEWADIEEIMAGQGGEEGQWELHSEDEEVEREWFSLEWDAFGDG